MNKYANNEYAISEVVGKWLNKETKQYQGIDKNAICCYTYWSYPFNTL